VWAEVFLFRTASYPVTTGVLFSRIKPLGCEVDLSALLSVEVMNAESYTSIPPYIFKTWCLIKNRDDFTNFL
jgi:hypothetical protein